jgi:molybdate transport system ATP-binding protein
MTVTMKATLAARHFDVDIALDPGERVALLGPNGAGKSTLLSILAGILRPDAGLATIDGQIMFDLSGMTRRWLPPWSRGVSLLAQDPLLFPHLTVLDNVAFGPKAAGKRTPDARTTARRWLTEVGAAEFAGRKPAQLSGGEAQRVAIARALAAEPRLLLLDEPLAALDVGAAPLLRQVLRRVLAARSVIIVTHDLLDALLLSDRVLVIDRGWIVESGPTEDVIRHPRTPFTARIAGLNMIRGRSEPDGVRQPNGQLIYGIHRMPSPAAEPAIAVFSPTAVAIFTETPHSSARNTVVVTIAELEPRDEQVRIRAATSDGTIFTADVTAQTISELDLYPGRDVFYAIKATAVTIYPA